MNLYVIYSFKHHKTYFFLSLWLREHQILLKNQATPGDEWDFFFFFNVQHKTKFSVVFCAIFFYSCTPCVL